MCFFKYASNRNRVFYIDVAIGTVGVRRLLSWGKKANDISPPSSFFRHRCNYRCDNSSNGSCKPSPQKDSDDFRFELVRRLSVLTVARYFNWAMATRLMKKWNEIDSCSGPGKLAKSQLNMSFYLVPTW